jgi:glycosyltransferase involved in cell wall biosynthesis
MCYWLVEGLRARGHRVVLVAAGPNHTSAELISTFPEPPSDRLGELFPDLVHAARAAHALEQAGVDVVHDHSAAGPLLAFGRAVPTVVTAHGPVDGEIGDYYRSLGDAVGLVAISNAQRGLAPDLPWIGMVHNAIPVEQYPFREDKEDFVLFLGRMNPEKGVHLAVEAARAAGFKLVIAAKCTEPAERRYFESAIRPQLGPGVEFVGQASTERKKDLLSRARCLLMPVLWEEPFGIVMIEALACGTPVVALRRGSIPEIVVDSVTGYVRDDPAELPEAIRDAERLAPLASREDAELRFDVDTMVSGYESVYRALVGQSRRSRSIRGVFGDLQFARPLGVERAMAEAD